MARHKAIHAAQSRVDRIPGLRMPVRKAARLITTRLPLSRRWQQRVRNVLSPGAPSNPVRFTVQVQEGRRIELRQRTDDLLGAGWYYGGYTGLYEPGTTRLMLTLARRASCAFEVGANVGYFTFLTASVMEGRGSLYAFEPNPTVYSVLSENAKINNLKGLHVEPLAMSDVDGRVTLHLPPQGQYTSNASLVPDLFGATAATEVTSTRFDTYCRSRGVRKVDLVKIDAEGSEPTILRGMGELLHAWLPDIIIEVLPQSEDAIREVLAGTPYRAYRIADDHLELEHYPIAHPVHLDHYLTARDAVPTH